LPAKIQEHQSSKIVITTESPGELITLHEMERRYVRQVLNAVGGNKTHAARILGIDRRSLYRRLEEPRADRKDETPTGASMSTPPLTPTPAKWHDDSMGRGQSAPPPSSGNGASSSLPAEDLE
jgi:Bacterial regulatory protein, Fis family